MNKWGKARGDYDAAIVSFFEQKGEMCLSEAIADGLRTVKGSKDRKLLGKSLRRLVAMGLLARRSEVRLYRGGYGYPQHLIVYRAITPQERGMNKHTQEPWLHFCDCSEPATPHPDSDGVVRLGFDDYERARVCVNACRGVSNMQLASASVSGAILMLKEAEQQRYELLAALVAITEHLASVMGGPLIAGAGVTFANGVESIPTIMKARAVIARAKGGAL